MRRFSVCAHPHLFRIYELLRETIRFDAVGNELVTATFNFGRCRHQLAERTENKIGQFARLDRLLGHIAGGNYATIKTIAVYLENCCAHLSLLSDHCSLNVF
jgi:hypothetical protein